MNTPHFPAMPRYGKAVLLIGMVGLVVGVVGIRFADPSWIKFFDNLHWTLATTAAAALAWLGLVDSRAKNTRARLWFALGLTGYAFGQILWDIQTAIGYNGFPAPSDLFYLWLGPCIAVGLTHELFRLSVPRQRLVILLDILILSVAALTLVLVLYLPRRADLALLPLAILIAYPVTLFAATCVGLAMITSFRLRYSPGGLLFLSGLAVTGWCWMTWNSMVLDGATIDGAWFNISFSVASLAMGAGTALWEIEKSSNPKYDRLCEWLLRMLPLLTVIAACAAFILSHVIVDIPWVIEQTTEVGSIMVILLAMIRQSMSLRERDQLLMAQRALHESEERRKSEYERLRQTEQQRDIVVREVHHRLKNNLQGVSGLLGLYASQYPEIAPTINDAIGKIMSVGVVFGLHGKRDENDIRLCEVTIEVCKAAEGLTHSTIESLVEVNLAQPILLDRDKAVPIALIVNELVTNALKHSRDDAQQGPVRVRIDTDGQSAILKIQNKSLTLPQGFDFDLGEGIGIGLTLVRSMLPTEGASLSLVLEDGIMTAELRLVPPVVTIPQF